MDMKLSYRDKVIFIVVMVILVLVAGFFLLIKPKFEAVDVAKYNLEATQAEWATLEEKINTYPNIVKGMKESLAQIEEQQKIFLEEGHPYVNERYIRDLLSEVNVEVNTVNTTYTYAGYIDRYIVDNLNILAYDNKMNADLFHELPQEVYDIYNGVERPTYPGAIVGVTNMSINFESDAAGRKTYDAINKLAEDEKTIILNTISTASEATNTDPTQDMSAELTLYSIYPLNVEKLKTEPETIEEAVEAAKKAATETPAA